MKKVTKIIVCFMVLILLQTNVGLAVDTSQQNIDNNSNKVLNVRLAHYPGVLDPQLAAAQTDHHVINNIFEGLMREVNGKIENGVAESYSISEDGTVYTFKLRDSKWSDGKPVTAQDFEYSWKRALNPETGAAYAFLLYDIKGGAEYNQEKDSVENVGIKSIDEKTLQVTLIKPIPYFLKLITAPIYMPVRKDIIEKNPGELDKQPDTLLSNGPFKISKMGINNSMELVKNNSYYKADGVKLDGIKFIIIEDDTEALKAYGDGSLDALDYLPFNEIPSLEKENKSFKYLPSKGTHYYMINTSKAPLNDLNVRKALSLAIDRKYIVQNIMPGFKAATAIVPSGLRLTNEQEFRAVAGDYGINPNTANVEEAKQLLAKAGYPDGEGFPEIELLYNTNVGHKTIGEAIQQMWKNNLGIDVKLKDMEWPLFMQTKNEKKFDIARGGWIGDFNDPVAHLEIWKSDSIINETNWKNSQFDKLITDSYYVTGDERDKLLVEAEKILMDEMVVLPIYYYTDSVMIRENVQNWYVSNLGYWYFGNTSI